MSVPLKINLNDQNFLEIEWDDGRLCKYPLKYLRDETPDAGNKGETILWKHIPPSDPGPDKPGKYEIESIELVGSYALSIKWKDGYDYGIYSWKLLLEMADAIEVEDNLPDFDNHEHKH
ncbi:MAG: DUF971 domain-containing protein [Melioribacteraceae bacterium]|nr:DUF971 domain-containing protein [Melioribacteraceae bacterium]